MGPLIWSLIPAVSKIGTRLPAAIICGSRRSKSGGKSSWPKPSGTPSNAQHGAPFSYGPRIKPSASWRM